MPPFKGTDMNDGRVLIGRDLSAAGTQTANCYVVKTTDANKWYRFKATIRGNGAETPAHISYTGAVIPANDRIALPMPLLCGKPVREEHLLLWTM